MLQVDPSNAGRARAWDGSEGGYWAEHADLFDRSVAAYDARFLAAAAVGATDRVLDIGCGTGQTTRAAARRASAGSALGVDLSAAMIAVARRRADREGIGNVRFVQADAQVYAFPTGSFDVVVSRTGAMFFGDPVAAFANLARAVRPAGRLALLAWQPAHRNEWLVAFSGALAAGRDLPPPPPDAPSPFSLGDPDRTRGLLSAAGFVDIRLEAVAGPMHFGGDADEAVAFVLGLLGWMLDGLDAAGRARACDALRASVEAHATPAGVRYDSAAWIVTARRP